LSKAKNIYPKSFPIGGTDFKTVLKEGSDHGSMHGDDREIHYKTNPSEQTFRTLYHEVLHAGLFMGGVNEIISTEEEAVIRCLENLTFDAMVVLFEAYLKNKDKDGSN